MSQLPASPPGAWQGWLSPVLLSGTAYLGAMLCCGCSKTEPRPQTAQGRMLTPRAPILGLLSAGPGPEAAGGCEAAWRALNRCCVPVTYPVLRAPQLLCLSSTAVFVIYTHRAIASGDAQHVKQAISPGNTLIIQKLQRPWFCLPGCFLIKTEDS